MVRISTCRRPKSRLTKTKGKEIGQRARSIVYYMELASLKNNIPVCSISAKCFRHPVSKGKKAEGIEESKYGSD